LKETQGDLEGARRLFLESGGLERGRGGEEGEGRRGRERGGERERERGREREIRCV
jgi:hypothetical protein